MERKEKQNHRTLKGEMGRKKYDERHRSNTGMNEHRMRIFLSTAN
jgi:hypothetical protein